MSNENNGNGLKPDYLTDITVRGLKCLRCNHEWLPRKAGVAPLTCPE